MLSVSVVGVVAGRSRVESDGVKRNGILKHIEHLSLAIYCVDSIKLVSMF